MSDMIKARFKPRRKVIGFRSCFFAAFWRWRRPAGGVDFDVIAEGFFS
jgi:hypothetical protein